MYIPANLLRTLTTPESLAYEVQRRKLKAALSDAAQAVKRHTYPASPEAPLNKAAIKVFKERLDFEKNSKVLPAWARPNNPALKRYLESVAYRAEVAAYKLQHKTLKQAEADARAVYHAFITPSDLE
jgi:hypothetical protein